MLPISVCIIAKNEENYIGECLRRLSPYDWEIVVVDTGSTDRTVEIARTYTPNIYRFDWINDFSAAKNFSVSKASNDYILSVDCDEYLENNDTAFDTISSLTKRVAPHQIGMLNLINPSAEFPSSGGTVPAVHEHIARFFNRKFTSYKGSIHEQLVSKDGKALEFIPVPLTFYHMGYCIADIKEKKSSRNITLLQAELQTNGPDPYLLFQLGQCYFGLSEYDNALPYFEQALSMEVNEQEEYVQTLVESYGYCLIHLGQYEKALSLEGVYPVFSRRADFVFLMGLIYMNNAMFENAVREFQKAASINNYAVEGTNSYLAYYNAGVIYECTGNIQEAVRLYRKCGNYAPALQQLQLIQNK